MTKEMLYKGDHIFSFTEREKMTEQSSQQCCGLKFCW
jgi:hypothetical protein